MKIDAHQHFWSLGRGDYDWPTQELKPIYRDFTPADLAPLLARTGVDATVLVQATPTLAETHFLLQLAAETPFVRGVVGWADFDAPGAVDIIGDLARRPMLKGLRPMIQNIAADRWILGEELTPVFEAMIKQELVFDALVLPRHLPMLRLLLTRHPRMRAVLDHAAKPDIKGGGFRAWADDMTEIARDTSAFCKLSGLWTEGGGDTRADLYQPYVDHLLNCFGPERLIWGSDWPVLTLAGEYEDWHDQCLALTSHISPKEQDAIFGGNARLLYELGGSVGSGLRPSR